MSENLSESQKLTSTAKPRIKNDAKTSGTKRLIKNESGVIANVIVVAHTNVKNDNRKHLITNV